MDRRLQGTSFPWIIVLISFSTLTESRLADSRGSGATYSHTASRSRGNIHQTPLTAVKQQQSAELSARPRPVVVNCHPDSMEVVVQADMFERGLQVDAAHLRLGSGSPSEGSACRAVPSGEAEFTIRAHLMDCGTKLSSTKEKIIYSNALIYSPEPSSDGLLRLDGATVPVECHYEKRYAVDGISLHPAWFPSVSMASAENQIEFNLLLMTDDWGFERGSHSYFVGDPIHFQASVILGKHMPLRIYIDHCFATATPDAEAPLRYDFIGHGCLADAYLTNSRSRFLPRVQEHQLRFPLDAFRFYQEPSNQIYITCYLKAVPVALTVSSQNRACSLIDNRWRSVDGNDPACRSCDASHQELPTEAPETVGSRAWPSMTPQERPDSLSVSHLRFPLGRHQSSAGLMKRGTEYQAEQTIQVGPIHVLPSGNKTTPQNRPTWD